MSRASGTHGPELGPFLEQLEQLLAGYTGEQLREILLAHAARRPTAERAGFLAIFKHSATGTPPSAGAADPTLIADITGFIDNVESGVYADGYGFDRDYGDYRTFGDETWTIEFDALAQRAGEALLAGDAAIARQAYQLLLEALGREYDEGGLPGAGLPTELVDTDLAEAKHRYLRAAWEDEPVGSRAAAVLAAAEETAFVGGDARLAALEATRREPLPDLDPVLPDMIAGLRAVPSGFGFGTQARRLLTECTQRYQGVDGLASLARAPGDQQAEAYRDWVDALAGAGRLDDAYAAAVEALDRLDGHGGTVAALGRRLAALAAARGEDEVVLAARWTVWRADPTLASLLEFAGCRHRPGPPQGDPLGRGRPVWHRSAGAAAGLGGGRAAAGRTGRGRHCPARRRGPPVWMGPAPGHRGHPLPTCGREFRTPASAVERPVALRAAGPGQPGGRAPRRLPSRERPRAPHARRGRARWQRRPALSWHRPRSPAAVFVARRYARHHTTAASQATAMA